MIEDNAIDHNYGDAMTYSSGIIQNNHLYRNYFSMRYCTGIIRNNEIHDNNGNMAFCDGVIQNNIIHNNSKGGLYFCTGFILNNLIYKNYAISYNYSNGGGMYGCTGYIHNNVIWGNRASGTGGGMFLCSGDIRNCIIWGNSGGSQVCGYVPISNSCIQYWDGTGEGNIMSDPMFMDPDAGDFHLQSSSPCIDAGDPGEEYEDRCLPPGLETARNDMGAYGGNYNCGDDVLPTPTPTPIPTPSPTHFVLNVPEDANTIQEAIDGSYDGYEIIVSPGRYKENIDFKGKNIIVRSQKPEDPIYIDATIIDGFFRSNVVSFSGEETSECRLSGFTIMNSCETDYGGGIKGNGCYALIDRNKIINNSAWNGGGISDCNGTIRENYILANFVHSKGAGLYSCDGLIENNHIWHNNAWEGDGGGIALSEGFVKNNNIRCNEAKFNGGGLFACNGTIKKNKIYYNKAGVSGGGIHSSEGVIVDNTIEFNYSPKNGGGICDSNGPIRGNDIRGNGASYGGGIANSTGKIIDNIIEHNYSGNSGSGVYNCSNNIKDNIIQYNTSSLYGGGIYLCSGSIDNNIIQNNKAKYGGGLYECSGHIRQNIIRDNTASQDGGGLYLCNGGKITFNEILSNYAYVNGGAIAHSGYNNGSIEANTIMFNAADYDGGAIYNCDTDIIQNVIDYNYCLYLGGGLSFCDGNIRNNIISNNASFLGGGLSQCNGIIANNSIFNNTSIAGGGLALCEGTIINCIIWENSANLDSQLYLCSEPSYCCIQDWIEGGTGNITDDPMFVDPLEYDFHLQAGSSCIDAGDPQEEYYDACMPPGMGTEINDMGAYGGPNNCEITLPLLISALADLTEYGDIWVADNLGAPSFESPTRGGWLGFRFEPENRWYPLKGNADASGIDDIIQITEYGDVWVSTSGEIDLNPPTRWGWLGFRYEEKAYKGSIPLSGDVDGTGSDDLIQVTEYGDAWVAISSEIAFNPPTRWGWLGFEFSRGEAGTPGAIPLAGDVDGDGLCDLIQITQYGDVWVALSSGIGFNPPTRWGWPGFKYAPYDGWYPLIGDVNADGFDDLIQITPTGDTWISLSTGVSYSKSTRWGWLNFYYDETQGYYPLIEDMNADGKADLIQITPSGEALVAPSTGTAFDYPEHWGWLGFLFDRDKGYLPFYLNY